MEPIHHFVPAALVVRAHRHRRGGCSGVPATLPPIVTQYKIVHHPSWKRGLVRHPIGGLTASG